MVVCYLILKCSMSCCLYISYWADPLVTGTSRKMIHAVLVIIDDYVVDQKLHPLSAIMSGIIIIVAATHSRCWDVYISMQFR